MPPDTSSRFGRYVVLDELSSSPGESTLLAFDPELDRKVRLEVFPLAFDGSEARRRERARVLASLAHPHVVRVHDVGTYEGQLFVAMEAMEGKSAARWVEQEQPPWPRVLEVFLAAGEGLAAAHTAGLVHGHVDLGAVFVGADEQVRVIGFVRSSPRPEARAADERTDTRDFCAALYRALWRRDPGDDGEAPSDTRVPRRVRRLIADGLDEGAALSLAAVLERLRAASRQRRRAGVTALVLATAGAVSAAVLAAPSEPEASRSWCEEVDARLSVTWNEDTASQIERAFEATQVSYASSAWEHARGELDAFADRWRQAHNELCAGSDDLRTAPRAAATVCLHRQYQAFEALLEALQAADAPLVASAAEAASSLGDPTSCRERPEDERYAEADLEQILAVESMLSRADVQHDLGRYDEGLALAREGHAQAKGLGVRALLGEAAYVVANIQAERGEEVEAEQLYHEAFSAAVASGHQEIVARSAMELSALLSEQGRHDEATRWTEHAAAAIERHDTAPLRTRLAAVRGLDAYRRGEYAQAKERYERSLELAETSDPPQPFAKIHASQALGNVLGRLGSTQAQIDLMRDVLAFTEELQGSEHPNVGHHLNSLGGALARRGSVDMALDAHARAVEVFEKTLGPDHTNTIAARTSYAASLQEAGRDPEAEVAYDTALDSARRTLDGNDPRYVTVLGNLGMFYSLQQRHVEAAALLAEAATRNEAIHGPRHSHTLGYLNNLAATYLFSGNNEDAREVYLKIITRTEEALGDDHPQMIPCLLGLATVETNLGEPQAAVPRLERALKIAIDRQERPERVGMVRFALAQARWDADDDRDEARALARAAAQSYVAARDGGWDISDRLDEVQAWLDAREG